MPPSSVEELVDHLFRRRSAALVAALTRSLGPRNLGIAEDVVQEALLKALRQWPFRGIPAAPEAWLHRVAKNLALDRLRRARRQVASVDELELSAASDDERFGDELSDDQLQMIFMCCHESLSQPSRVALTLKTLGGFSVNEIARAQLISKSTVAQRLVRAKKQLHNEAVAFALPNAAALSHRLESVQEVIYLLFNEGYCAHEGHSLVRNNLVDEAIRLSLLLCQDEATATPSTHALCALIFFQAARLPARLNDTGHLLLMAEQDRSRWDRKMIGQGFGHLQASMAGEALTTFHLEAGIASCHVAAASFAETNWEDILRHYDRLLGMTGSPVVALNRIVALSMVRGWEAALDALDKLENAEELADYYLLPATRAELLRNLGRNTEALPHLRRALELAANNPQRQYIQKRIANIEKLI